MFAAILQEESFRSGFWINRKETCAVGNDEGFFREDFVKSDSRGAIENFRDQGDGKTDGSSHTDQSACVGFSRFRTYREPPLKKLAEREMGALREAFTFELERKRSVCGEGFDQEACARSWIVSNNCWAG